MRPITAVDHNEGWRQFAGKTLSEGEKEADMQPY